MSKIVKSYLLAVFAHLAIFQAATPPALASVWQEVDIGSDPFAARVYCRDTPSFVIADKGVRHDLAPFYSPGLIVVGPDVPAGPVAVCHCVLVSGPAGMTVSGGGTVEWIPGEHDIGISADISVRITVSQGGAQVFAATKNFPLKVIESLPQLYEPSPVISYERAPLGWSGSIFSGYQPNDADRKLFRWSLINPPPGARIDEEGGLHWPDDRGHARTDPYVFKVRIDYETATGWVSDEVTWSRRVLPRAATNDFRDLRSWEQPVAAGMLGFSTAAGDGWLAAGEPSPELPGKKARIRKSGRVRLWKAEAGGEGYVEQAMIEPELGSGALGFGASVSISAKDGQHPTRIAVGAPESGNGVRKKVGRVHVYACDAGGSWNQEAILDPPVIRRSLYFGGWVSIRGDTLLASMEGMNVSGTNTGALAVYRHDGSGWNFSEMLEAPKPARGDFFSYPNGLSKEWIAAAANEDDDHGHNAGAVHLFQRQGERHLHRQTIYAPVPEAGALFGERLLIDGPWLFVSSFRGQTNKGSVHVFRLTGETWSFHQTLESPFATSGSAFGMGLGHADGVLAVSAPGFLFGGKEIAGSASPWRGITLFRLEGNAWIWSRQVTEDPDGSPGATSWGFSVTQLSPDMTVASKPDFQAYANGEYFPLGGRLFLHRWPEAIADHFSEVLARLPEVGGRPATADGDGNSNGVPNVIDWMIGQDPGAGPDGWTAQVPLGKRPFLKLEAGSRGMRFMVPELRPALRHRAVIEVSQNLIDWEPVPGARWEPLAETYFPLSDGSRALTYFHPVFLPIEVPETGGPRFVRLSVTD